MNRFSTLAISNEEDLIFGNAITPLKTRRGLEIGGGIVYPEINLTLPSVEITDHTYLQIKRLYLEAIEDICQRACDLHSEGIVIEFETLIEMTKTPSYAIGITTDMNEVLERFYQQHGLKSSLRITPNDAREMVRPPRMREGEYLRTMLETFEGCANAGAEFLSIESTGGKEIHDDALIACDISQVLFALAVMGCRDMSFLWKQIVSIAEKTSSIAAGDTACGFGNTAMVLAEKKMIPKTFAAVVRAMTAPRSLVAYEVGAKGPGKDCGYENIYMKAITGFPMSMEGRTSSCAHSSPVGNVAAVSCDLWSNESVQMVKLLGGMAPTVSTEQLIYDCRLFNTASKCGCAQTLRNLHSDSDAGLDPQAYVLTPKAAIAISEVIVSSKTNYEATKRAGLKALELITEAHENKQLELSEMERPWLSMLGEALEAQPDKEELFIERMLPIVDTSKFEAASYDLSKHQGYSKCK